jgi:hypothetical protein
MCKELFSNMRLKTILLLEELKNSKREHRISLSVYKSLQASNKEFMINKQILK